MCIILEDNKLYTVPDDHNTGSEQQISLDQLI